MGIRTLLPGFHLLYLLPIPVKCLVVSLQADLLGSQLDNLRSSPPQAGQHRFQLEDLLKNQLVNQPVNHRWYPLHNLLCFHLLDRLYNRVVNRQQLHLDNLVRSLRQVNLVHSLLLYQVVSQRSLQLQVALQKPVTQTHLLGVLR